MATFFYPDSMLTFGKYKGQRVSDILERDPDYIAWCTENISWFRFRPQKMMTKEGILIQSEEVYERYLQKLQLEEAQHDFEPEEEDDYGLGFDYDGNVYEL